MTDTRLPEAALLVTVEDLAALLDMSVERLTSWLGFPPLYRIGAKVGVRWQEVGEWLEEQIYGEFPELLDAVDPSESGSGRLE